MKKLIYLFAAPVLVLAGCDKVPETGPVDPEPDKPFMNLPSDTIEFALDATTETLDVSTNVDDIICNPFDKWCEADYDNGVLTVSVTANPVYTSRKTTVELRGGGLFRQVFVSQSGMKMPDYSDAVGFDHTTLFTDPTCSELKPGIGLTDIDKVTNGFYKKLAVELFNGTYDSEFRVQTYKAWPDPGRLASSNKTRAPSLRDNPTGMAVLANSELVVFMSETDVVNISLLVQEPKKEFRFSTSYPLTPGVNKINVTHGGLMYVMYHTATGVAPDVKIHIATGLVNGYFDSQKHPAERWRELITKAKFENFDLVGKYAHLTFETNAFLQYTTDGKALIDIYDDIVWLQREFSGLNKYKRAPRNRQYFLVDYEAFMHADAYHMSYGAGTQENLLTVDKLKPNSWGPCHEVGHMHQVRTALSWHGLTEVTVNLYTMAVQTAWGLPGWLIADGNPPVSRYEQAFREVLDAKIAYIEHSHVMCRLVPFWQLKLYMHNVLGNDDFYKEVHEAARNAPYASYGGRQVEFAKMCCDAAQLDLTEFFEAWGFLKAITVKLDDYGSGTIAVTQQMVNDAKAYIATKNYPKPARDFTRITDANWTTYK